MKNPREEISLSDYENHMKLDSVMQLQTMNEMMKGQFDTYPISSVMILGVAGGNGLEHISKDKFERVYGVDVNSDYLKEVTHRYKIRCRFMSLWRMEEKSKRQLKSDVMFG